MQPAAGAVSSALEGAHNGDVLRIHPGHYVDNFQITKAVRLKGVGDSRPVIDADCNARATIEVRHSGVTLENLRVQGADEDFGAFPSEVDFQSVVSGTARNLRTIDTCDAEYGINAFDTGHVKILDNFGKGFSDSGIYVGSITDTHGGTLLVRGNKAVHNNRGAIIEDTFRNTDVVFRQNVLKANTLSGEGAPDGLFLHNSDGITITANTSDDNGASGYHADVTSDHNHFVDNTADGNGGGPYADDSGHGNCGAGNSFSIPGC